MLRTARKVHSLLPIAQPYTEISKYIAPTTSHRAPFLPVLSLFSTDTSTTKPSTFISARPHSLKYDRDPPPQAVKQNPGPVRKLFLTLGGYYSKESLHMRASHSLYKSIIEQATNPSLFQELDVPHDFQHQHSILCLHVWLILVRLRSEGADGKQLAQIMYDNFQDDVENRVRKAGIKVRVSKQLTLLEEQFYGSCMAYDKAINQNEEPKESLASALLRNVYQGDTKKKAAAAKLETYVKLQMACLSMTESSAVMAGHIKF